MIVGYYHRYGYAVWSDGQEIYRAGNSPFDSTYVAALSDGSRVESLETLARWCEQTARETANERGEKFGGTSFDEDADDMYADLFGDPPIERPRRKEA